MDWWLAGGRGVGAEGQLEYLDIPYTTNNKVHLPLRPKISLYYTSTGGWLGGWVAGWLAGWLEFDFIAISAQLNWDLGSAWQ